MIEAPLRRNQRPSPFVGPRAYSRDDSAKLRGRDPDISALLDQLIADRIVLMYSPSGAGKSSLINAGLIPKLEEQEFHVLPVARVSRTVLVGGTTPDTCNRYVLSVLTSLEEQAAEPLTVDQLTGMSIDRYLEHQGGGGSRSVVLILDQFEEIVTLDPTDLAAKRDFFSQLGIALRSRDRWALFSMREEYVATLDEFLPLLPTRLSSRYRLERLTPAAALQAIREPTAAAGVTFEEKAAQRIVDNLRLVRVQLISGRAEQRPGPFVEPVQLQVVCQRIWEKLQPEQTTIGQDEVEGVSVDQALADYYTDRLREVVSQGIVAERVLRQWFDKSLIIGGSIRGQVPRGDDGLTGGLPDPVVRRLVDTFLVRSEERRGATWYELAHDRLVRPIAESNAAWLHENAAPLQRQANLWNENRRQAGYLLTGVALREAEAWARRNPADLDEIAREFLIASRERKRRARLAGALVAVTLLLVLMAGYMVVDQARAGARRADSLTISAEKQLAVELQTTPDTGNLVKVRQTVLANEAIAQVARGRDSTRGTVVDYRSRAADQHKVYDALEALDFQLDTVSSRLDTPTNAVAFGSQVPLDDVKLVMFALLRAGIDIRRCRPLVNDRGRERVIQVYGDASLTDPPWTVDEVRAYKRQGRPTASSIRRPRA